MNITFKSCARCGEDHENIEVKELQAPDEFTHYCFCPTNGEPILVTIEELKEVVNPVNVLHSGNKSYRIEKGNDWKDIK